MSATHTKAQMDVFRSLSAAPAVREELARYDSPALDAEAVAQVSLPLEDEAHVERWQLYEAEARAAGVFDALQQRFVQLRFPIRAGLSQDADYRRATKRGDFEAAASYAPGLELERPDRLALEVVSTAAGRLPVIVADTRSDFVALVRAFTERNEPAPVPDALGACLVSGLNNWDRINAHRETWPAGRADEEWRRLVANKPLHQDRLLLLSRGHYGGTRADAVGLDETDWLARSLVVRREHEVTHYLTWRLAGRLRSHLLDELVADFAGLTAAFGRYLPDLALACLGLDETGRATPGGRMQLYRQASELTSAAFDALGPVVVRSVQGIDAISRACASQLREPNGVAKVSLHLLGGTLADLARCPATLKGCLHTP
jgi:hypothetical protein